MSVRLSCPSCGFHGDVEAFLVNAEESHAVLTALSVPPMLAAPLQQYLRLFRPPQRVLQARRLQRLLDEIVPDIKRAEIERHGRLWTVPAGYWADAMDRVVSKAGELSLPLRDHGYLYQVLVGIVNRAESRTEQKTEETRAYPYSTPRNLEGPAPIAQAMPEPAPRPAPIPAEARASMDRILRRNTQGGAT